MSLFLANACELLQIENSTPFTDIIRMWSIGDFKEAQYTISEPVLFLLHYSNSLLHHISNIFILTVSSYNILKGDAYV